MKIKNGSYKCDKCGHFINYLKSVHIMFSDDSNTIFKNTYFIDLCVDCHYNMSYGTGSIHSNFNEYVKHCNSEIGITSTYKKYK